MPADSVSFDKTETEALRMIVSDWVNAKIVSPPYNREIEFNSVKTRYRQWRADAGTCTRDPRAFI